MVDAVLIVLREVLEAALLLSLLLALSRKRQLNLQWGWIALITGIIGSWLLAHFAGAIAEAMDGTGQEILNAALYCAVIVSIIVLALKILPIAFQPGSAMNNRLITIRHHRWIQGLSIIVVSFSLTREGSEIWIYLSGYVHQPDKLSPALVGAAIGTGLGMSLGALIYYVFVFMSQRYFLPVFLVVISLIAGGLSMQIAKQLMQIGLLDSGAPLWDSSFLISQHSWLGELLYALVGYDSRPTPIQGFFYVLTLGPLLVACGLHTWRLRAGHHE
jgi:high-affinity iron transporter